MDVLGDDRTYEWSLDGQRWMQGADGTFTLNEAPGFTPGTEPADLDFLLGAHPAAAASTWLPSAFSHCPNTGAPLPAVKYQPQNRWLPPYGNGSGRRVVENDCQLDGAEAIVARLFEKLKANPQRSLNDHKDDVVAPRRNGLNFLVANLGGHREALFALDREGGLFLWQRLAGQWRTLLPEVVPIGRSSLPHWAWGVALRAQGEQQALILAGDEGACEVSVNPLSGRYRLQRHAGKALAAPGELDQRVLIPQQMPDGRVCLVERTADGWQEHPIVGADSARMGELSAPLCQPSSRRLIWIGTQGYLSMQFAESLEAQWLDWPNGAQAHPEYGAPFMNGEGTWQQLFEVDRQYYLRLGSDQTQDLQGSRLSSGKGSYKFNVRLDTPWAEHDEHINPFTRDLVYPFVEFNDNKHQLSFCVRETSSVQKLFDNDQPLDTLYRLERIGDPPLELLVKVSQPWNAQWFFYDSALWLYIDSSGALYRWNA